MTDIPAAFMAAMRELPVHQLEEIVAAGIVARKAEVVEGRRTTLRSIGRLAYDARVRGTAFTYDEAWTEANISRDQAADINYVIQTLPLPDIEKKPRSVRPDIVTQPEGYVMSIKEAADILTISSGDTRQLITKGCLQAYDKDSSKVSEKSVMRYMWQHPGVVQETDANRKYLGRLEGNKQHFRHSCGGCGSRSIQAA